MITLPSWSVLSPEQFAAFVGLLGPKVVRVDDMYWAEVRRFFYRPLQPLQVLPPDNLRKPLAARLGGVQYAVAPDQPANSHLNCLVFDQTQDYTAARLDKNRRRQVKLAERVFQIRPVTDRGEFKTSGHPVYLSFHDRTGYKVGSERRDPARFSAWVDAVCSIPGVLILGGYEGSRLCGISLTYRVGSTVFYATFFCDDAALRGYLSDLMLHNVRELAATTPGVTHVYAGMFKGIRGLDDFYLHRGARLLRQRARLELNPLAHLLLKRGLPRQYSQLLGNLAPASTSPEQPATPSPGVRAGP